MGGTASRTAAAWALLLVATPLVSGHHVVPPDGAGVEHAGWDGPRAAEVTFRGVAFLPDGSALVAGGTSATDGTSARQVLLRWRPTAGVTTLLDRAGPPFTAIAAGPAGTALVVAQRDMVLLWSEDATRDLWSEAVARGTFATPSNPGPFTFLGLDAAWSADGGKALVAGSSLLLYTAANDTATGLGPLEVIHGGAEAFFNGVAWDPGGRAALVAGGVQQEAGFVLGALWLTDGRRLTQSDALAIYGAFAPTRALVNAIAYNERGTQAIVAGRDGPGATMLSFDPVAYALARQGRDTRYASYLPTVKASGSITDLAWSSDARLIAAGRETDTLLLSDGCVGAPLLHGGRDLFAVDWHPSGRFALAAGAEGRIVSVTPVQGPYGAVVAPPGGAFATPTTTVSVMAFAFDAARDVVAVRARVAGAGDDAWQTARLDGARGTWNATIGTHDLDDGDHTFEIELFDSAGATSILTHPFLVNNERFEPAVPRDVEIGGLEAGGADTDGVFTVSWASDDTGVNFELEHGAPDGARSVMRVGALRTATVSAETDGAVVVRVRALNRFFTSEWSPAVTVQVLLDRDGDGVPDRHDPNPLTPDVWGDRDGDGVPDHLEERQCSDPDDRASTPTSDDDGDGWANGIECELGTDPLDARDHPGVVAPPPDAEDPPPPKNDTPSLPLGAVLVALCAAARRLRPGQSSSKR